MMKASQEEKVLELEERIARLEKLVNPRVEILTVSDTAEMPDDSFLVAGRFRDMEDGDEFR